MWHALATYEVDGVDKTALVLGNQLFDLASLIGDHGTEEQRSIAGKNTTEIIKAWDDGNSAIISSLATKLSQLVSSGSVSAVGEGTKCIKAPYEPTQIFGTASNFVEHAAEMKTALAAKADSQPYVFLKATTSVIGPGEAVIIPYDAEKPDWEAELAVVIGKGGRRISVNDAPNHIAGYTIANDISARDLNRRDDFPFKHDWFRGKSWDSFCPLGPWFVPASLIEDPHNVRLGLTLNGETKQDGNTNEMIFDIYEQIAYLSRIVTLQPGD